MLEKIKRFFSGRTSYPPQVLPPKALEVVEQADNFFTNQSIQNECDLFILERQVSLRDQFKSVKSIVDHITKDTTGYYLPRSIAFYIQADGTWVFLIGIRCNQLSNETLIGVWLHLLTMTNNGRIVEQ
jgi:hypothetical protein